MTGTSPSSLSSTAYHPGFILFTTPIYLNNIPPDSRTCPICSEPYIEPLKARPRPEDTDEWAMRVDMSATDEGSTKCCGHIFGRRCLEKHINSQGAWHNKCPLCRQAWWITPVETLQHASRGTASGQRVHDGGIERRRSSRRQDRPSRSSLVREVLDTFAVQGMSEQIDATLEEVEQKLALIYRGRGQSAEHGLMAALLNHEQQLGEDSEAVGAS